MPVVDIKGAQLKSVIMMNGLTLPCALVVVLLLRSLLLRITRLHSYYGQKLERLRKRVLDETRGLYCQS